MRGKRNGSRPAADQHEMRQYLYGELDEPARALLEEQFFADQAKFAELERLEDQLVDDYVSNVMSAAERQKFETAYLISARRREKLRFAQDLHQSLAAPSQIAATSLLTWRQTLWQRPTLRYSLVAATVLFMCLSVWWMRSVVRTPTPLPEQVARSSTPTPVATAEAVRENVSPSPVATEKPKASRPKPAAGAVLLSVLSPDQLRDGSGEKATNKIIVPPSVKTVLLQIQCDPRTPQRAYRVVIETAAGQSFLAQGNLKAQKNILRIPLSAQRLHTEDYLLTLFGLSSHNKYEELRDYSFRVVKK